MANQLRGEVSVDLPTLGTLTLRPTFEAGAELEQTCGSIYKIIEKISQNDISLTDTVEVIYTFHRGYMREIGNINQAKSREAIGRDVMSAGYMNFALVVGQVLMSCLGNNGEEVEETEGNGGSEG